MPPRKYRKGLAVPLTLEKDMTLTVIRRFYLEITKQKHRNFFRTVIIKRESSCTNSGVDSVESGAYEFYLMVRCGRLGTKGNFKIIRRVDWPSPAMPLSLELAQEEIVRKKINRNGYSLIIEENWPENLILKEMGTLIDKFYDNLDVPAWLKKRVPGQTKKRGGGE